MITDILSQVTYGAQEMSVKLTDEECNDAGMIILELGFIDLFQVMILILKVSI